MKTLRDYDPLHQPQFLLRYALVDTWFFLAFQDYALAIEYFKLAADQGWVDGQLQLGTMHYRTCILFEIKLVLD
jgi:TPR repeat protein